LNDKLKKDLIDFNEKIKLNDIEILNLKSKILNSYMGNEISVNKNSENTNNININNIRKNSLKKEIINSPNKTHNDKNNYLVNNNFMQDDERSKNLSNFNLIHRSSSAVYKNNSDKKLSIKNYPRKISNIKTNLSNSNEKIYVDKINKKINKDNFNKDEKINKKSIPRFFIEIGFKLFFDGIKRSNLRINEKNK
jgi:hypothetical protein